MAIYILIFCVTIIFLLFSKEYYTKFQIAKIEYENDSSNINYEQKKDYYDKYLFFLILSILFLGIITGLRNRNVGTDLNYTYIPQFYNILNGNNNAFTEKGFVLLNKIIQIFTNKYQSIILITSIIFAASLCRIAIKKSKSVVLTMIVTLLSTFYFTSLNNVRQSIACIILIEGFYYLIDKKFWKYLIVILIASIFHITSLIMVPMYFIFNSKKIRKHFLISCLLVIILIPVLSKLFIIIASHTKYYYYFVSEFNNYSSNRINIAINGLWLLISFALLYNEKDINKESYVLLFIQTCAFLISYLSLFISISEMISRIASYFIFYQILLIPYLVNREKEKKGKIILTSTYIITYGFYMYYFIIVNGYHSVLPFKFM